MFKGHPKGLYVLFFTEMWERFGFYTMLAVFVYYMQENFGWDATQATNVYGLFLAGVYITPLIGGWIADNVLGYGKTITIGAIVMGLGYTLMATPTDAPMTLYIALTIVAIGNGFFKANISVLVGNLYSHSSGSLKDAGYNIFYMGINVGAFYAPFAAAGIKQYFMDNFGTTLAQGYNAAFGVAAIGMVFSLVIFLLFRRYYKDADFNYSPKYDKSVASKKISFNINTQSSKPVIICAVGILVAFLMPWIQAVGTGISGYNLGQLDSYGNYVWIIPILSGATILLSFSNINNRVIGAINGIVPLSALTYLIIRLSIEGGSQAIEGFTNIGLKTFSSGFYLTIIFSIAIIIFAFLRKHYKDADYQSRPQVNTDKEIDINTEKDVVLTKEQEKERILALLTIFAIVIFFWLAFHQNGAALSLFAKDYTDVAVGKFTFVLFDIIGLHALLAVILGAAAMFNKSLSAKIKGIAGVFIVAGLSIIVYKMNNLPDANTIAPEQFQSFNPMFIILLTPLVVGWFAFLNKKGKEPSSPAKIGIGMLITAAAYVIMVFASQGLTSVYQLSGQSSAITVSPFWLFSTYFMLTIAELHLSPMGLSFVSKVSPPKMKGLMMGGWFGATAIGNYLSGFVGRFYQNWELWQFFVLLVITSIFAALLLRLFLKKLKHATE